MTVRACILLFASIHTVLASCLTPPAVLQGIHIDAQLAIQLYPEGTERVELALPSGESLRGIFVPGGEGAPVVLHLLEAAGSVASLKHHYEVLCRQLQGLGLASLLVDYTGVGGSDGQRSAKNLERDAQLMWTEALARAGGDPDRVILRGISLGTIASSLLLKNGVKPGAVILHAPVLADSAVYRVGARWGGILIGWLADAIFADPANVSLTKVLRQYKGRLLVAAGKEDFFLTDRERSELKAAVQAAHGDYKPTEYGHLRDALCAHTTQKDELEFLVDRFFPAPLLDPELDAIIQRFSDMAGESVAKEFEEAPLRNRFAELAKFARNVNPLLIAAVAAQNEVNLESLRYIWMLNERAPSQWEPFQDLVQMSSLQDPAGALPMDTLERYSLAGDIPYRFGGKRYELSRCEIVRRIKQTLEGGAYWHSLEIVSPIGSFRFHFDTSDLIAGLRARGIPEEELMRVGVRILLKANRIPERVRLTKEGHAILEVLDQNQWHELDMNLTAPSIESHDGEITEAYELGAHAVQLLGDKAEKVYFKTRVTKKQFEVRR